MLKNDGKRYALYIILSVLVSSLIINHSSVIDIIWHSIELSVGIMIIELVVNWFLSK